MLGGDRMSKLSDEARLLWPFIFGASNGYCRFQIDYLLILEASFRQFSNKPSEEKLRAALTEYRDANLLFIYQAEDGSVWGSWDSQPSVTTPQRYFSKRDKSSPTPPVKQFESWRSKYIDSKKEVHVPVNGSLGSSLLSVTSQIKLDFSEKSGPNSCITKLQTTNSELLTSNYKLQTPTSCGAEFSQTEEPAPEVVEAELVAEPSDESKYWSALLFAANQAHMIYAEGELDRIRDRYGQYAVEDRRAAIAGVDIRLRMGEWSDAHYVPSLRNYVFDRRWTAKLRPGPRLVEKPGSQEAATEKFLQRMAEEQAETRGLLKSG